VSDRHLLLVTYHFPPSGASGTYRLLGFSRHLRHYGWRISVIAPPCLPWEPVDERLLAQLPSDVAVHSVPYPRGRASKVFRSMAKFGVWLPRALRKMRSILSQSKPDAVLTSGPPHCVHALGLYAKRRFGLPWAADFRDPWVVGDPQEHWRSLRVRCARRWEQIFLSNANLVISNAPRAQAMLSAAYPRYGEKIVTVTNGFDPESFPKRPQCSPDRAEIRIVHTGEIYFGRDPRPFLDALRSLHGAEGQESQLLRTRFLGRATGGEVDLEAEIRSRGLSASVSADGQVSYDYSRRIMADANILVLFDSPGRKVGVPAKLYEYLGAGGAILALTEEDGDAAWVLRQSGATHRVVPPLQTERIRQALDELISCVRTPTSSQPSTRRILAFTRAATARVLAEHLDRMVSAMPSAENALGTPPSATVRAESASTLPLSAIK
jgi:glycosyltransferase involved in cell wall biosynthesis